MLPLSTCYFEVTLRLLDLGKSGCFWWETEGFLQHQWPRFRKKLHKNICANLKLKHTYKKPKQLSGCTALGHVSRQKFLLLFFLFFMRKHVKLFYLVLFESYCMFNVTKI
jgi:hypothetical protein